MEPVKESVIYGLAPKRSSDRMRRKLMKYTRTILISLVMACLIWSWFSWPLPARMADGIPASAHRSERIAARYMQPGDHLQLLYYFKLVEDMFTGSVPWFHNLYEFNLGDDEATREVGTYYAPFSIIFAAISAFGGQALGWNLTAIFSLWMTMLFTWLLVRRYVGDNWIAGATALLSIALPYRWGVVLGGSPAGFGMMWIPIILLGLDGVVRDRSMPSGLLAGLALIMSEWIDTHVFFFATLLAPCWCLFAYWFHAGRWWPERRDWPGLLKAALPFAVCAGIVVFQAAGINQGLASTRIGAGEGRKLWEVGLYSPNPRELLDPLAGSRAGDIYIGWIIPLLLLAGLLTQMIRQRQENAIRKTSRSMFLYSLLLVALLTIALLATGLNNPGGERAWALLTRLIPPYGMIRQPTRIFVLAPTLLAVAIALALQALAGLIRLKKLRPLVPLAFVVWVAFAYGYRFKPAICLLDKEQAAYRSIVLDAQREGVNPHILALPIWPGDSHWSSLYQYYCGLYGVRMLNGYRPTVREEYYQKVFLPLESCNKGLLTNEQLNQLFRKGIHYIVLHENAFPEKVSPFAVGHTLQSMLNNPRLSLLATDRGVWAFRIEGKHARRENAIDLAPALTNAAPLACPARIFQAERCTLTQATVQASETASGHQYAQLADSDATLETPPYPMYHIPGLSLQFRMRGNGALQTTIFPGQTDPHQGRLQVASTNWTWHSYPIPAFAGYRGIPIALRLERGHVDIDLAMLTLGAPPNLKPGKSITIPALLFFHAGYTDPKTGDVIFTPERDADDAIFYGPRIPLPVGTYRISLDYSSDALNDHIIGYLSGRYGPPNDTLAPIINGQPAELIYHQPDNRRLAFNFTYCREAPVRISAVHIERIR